MDRFQTNNTLILWWLYTHTFFTYVSCCISYLTLLMANIENRKKLQLIQTIWDVMALLTILDFPLETTCSCKQDTIERYWGQQFWQTERHISVRLTEMARPVTVDHLQRWSRIFRSAQTEMVRSICWTNQNFRNFGLNGNRPRSLPHIRHLYLLFCFLYIFDCNRLLAVAWWLIRKKLWNSE